MNQCDCYCIEQKTRYMYDQFTGRPIPRIIEVGICRGTKERDECSCGGDEIKCDFYPEVREKALKEQEPKLGNWINVEDRLPEIESTGKGWGNHQISKSVRVLCVCKQKSGKVLVKEGYYEIWDDNQNPYWKIPGSIDSVTHWMSMPEPPKGE